MNEGLGFLAQKTLGDAVLAYPLIGLPILAALALVAFANAREARLRKDIKRQRDTLVPSTKVAPAPAPLKSASTIAATDSSEARAEPNLTPFQIAQSYRDQRVQDAILAILHELKRSIFFAAGLSQNPGETKLRSAFLNVLSAKMWRRVSPIDTNPGDPDAYDIADAEIAPFLSAPFPTSLHRYAEYVAFIRGDIPYEEVSDATVQVVTDYWSQLDEEQRLSLRSWNIPWICLVPEIAEFDDE